MRKINYFKSLRLLPVFLGAMALGTSAYASSHREAPLISNDPQADNTDLYVFRSPDDTNTVTIIANYIPFESPEGGPNYYSFGTNVRYEIHIKNQAGTTTDDITYRFTFSQVDQDTTTFFNIRLGKQNLKMTYICEKSVAGGAFVTIYSGGIVPPPNIGPRSIENATVGLGAPSYLSLMTAAIATATTGEQLFCGPVDDPFFVDLGGTFDLGNFRPFGLSTSNVPKDGLARFNCHTIAIRVPISMLQANGLSVSSATSILDSRFVIGVWASASRLQIKTIATGDTAVYSGAWVQVSRIGMPLTNEVVIPVGMKDYWNSQNPANDVQFAKYFDNPELALYMDNSKYGGAVPALNALRIQSNSLQSFDFRNGHKGLFGLKGTAAVAGTALDNAAFGNVLLPDSTSPRAVDILPIFFTGVPNLAPYQLATGKPVGNPLAHGKPFINNFLPTLGDMLRLNMAVPVTSRTDPNFSSEGIIAAAVLGLTNAAYDGDTALQFIPNMDGFPNGRRLEDDVTTIELQAVGGVALAAIGLWYDDYTPGVSSTPVTTDLGNVLGFNAGITHNDTTFQGYQVLPAAYGADLGANWKPLPNLFINTAVWYLYLQQEFTFGQDLIDQPGGPITPSGATIRKGVDFSARYEITKWLFANLNVNFARPRFVDSAGGHDYVPLAPTLTSTASLNYRFKNGINGGISYRYLHNRAANSDYSLTALGYFITDLTVNYTRKRYEVGVAIENLFNQQWNESQFEYTSRLYYETKPVDQVSYTPGVPFFAKLKLTVFF